MGVLARAEDGSGFGWRYRPALLGVESDGCNCLGINGLPAGRTLEVDRADERTGGRVRGLLTVAHQRRRVTKGCCPSPFEVFTSEIGCSLAGSEMLALLPSFWTALISHGRRRRRWVMPADSWGRWVFDLFAMCALMLEGDDGIGFSVLSSSL
ncbi:hypothetical protein ACLOJK_027827 [Asimina triloba]